EILTVKSLQKLDITVHVYPNPTLDVFHIQFHEMPEKRIQVSLLNAKGQILKQQDFAANYLEMNINTLPSGIYILNLKATDSQAQNSYKIIKK
ncbi:MAG: T9SS type A sorting domain-containing protein, partial [Saprospiraceae bacterium]|nr:T9SS type A sorting domain-containing protein [Saprospiraceae bacterium]